MKVRELMKVLAASDPDEQVHVALDLSSPNSSSAHSIREVHDESAIGGEVEIVVNEAFDLRDSPPWLAAALFGESG